MERNKGNKAGWRGLNVDREGSFAVLQRGERTNKVFRHAKSKMILHFDTFCMYFHNSTYKCIVVDPLYWRGDPLTLLLLFQYVFNVFDCLTLVRCE